MRATKRWLQIIGAFYVLQFIMMVFVHAPIKTMAPPGALDRADAGDLVARFLVDTWMFFGMEVGGIGIALLLASRARESANSLVLAVVIVELTRGILADTWYAFARGDHWNVIGVWLVVHTAVIVTGVMVLRRDRAIAARLSTAQT